MDAGPDSTAAKERADNLRECLHKAYDRTGHLQPAIDRPMATMPARSHSTVRMAGW